MQVTLVDRLDDEQGRAEDPQAAAQMRECLHTALSVVMNMSHHNDAGCRQVSAWLFHMWMQRHQLQQFCIEYPTSAHHSCRSYQLKTLGGNDGSDGMLPYVWEETLKMFILS